MKIRFTQHARKRMVMRKISKDHVRLVLSEPDNVGYGYLDRNINYKKFTDGIIKVVYTKEKGICIIISVIWD